MRRRLKGNFPTNRRSGHGTRNSTLALVSGQSMLLPARHGAMAAGWRTCSSRYLKDFKQEGGVPACSLASCLDASLGLIGTDEIEGEAAQDGHILRAVAGPVA